MKLVGTEPSHTIFAWRGLVGVKLAACDFGHARVTDTWDLKPVLVQLQVCFSICVGACFKQTQTMDEPQRSDALRIGGHL